MAQRAAWVAQAFYRYHAREITWEQLRAVVRQVAQSTDSRDDTTR